MCIVLLAVSPWKEAEDVIDMPEADLNTALTIDGVVSRLRVYYRAVTETMVAWRRLGNPYHDNGDKRKPVRNIVPETPG